MSGTAGPRRDVVLVTGLSGAGKASVLRALEDMGYAAIDNPPLTLIEDMVARTDRPLAIGVDCRTDGFDEGAVLATAERLRLHPALALSVVFMTAEVPALLARYTETRRRHPMAPRGRISDGIRAEQAMTAAIKASADMVIDTSDLPLAGLRQMIERRFGADSRSGFAGITVSLISFAFPKGLPREADMVLDARFLRNPHYDAQLRPLTGLDPAVGDYIRSDPDYAGFMGAVRNLIDMVLPRFVQEGKKYATICVGCTGGRHRSVHIIETLGNDLVAAGWRVHFLHREIGTLDDKSIGSPSGFHREGGAETRFEDQRVTIARTLPVSSGAASAFTVSSAVDPNSPVPAAAGEAE